MSNVSHREVARNAESGERIRITALRGPYKRHSPEIIGLETIVNEKSRFNDGSVFTELSFKNSESTGFLDATYVDYVVLEEVPGMNVKIHRLSEHARIPTYGSAAAAAFDLYAAADVIIAPGETKKVPLGFAVEIPDGYEMQIRPRSGVTWNTKLRVANSPATIDSDFRGEVVVILDNTHSGRYPDGAVHKYGFTIDGKRATGMMYGSYLIRRGDRIAQALVLPVPRVTFEEVAELSDLTETARGDGGFGSSGV